MRTCKPAAAVFVAVVFVTLGLADRAWAQNTTKKPPAIQPVPTAAEALFAKYNTNGDKFLDEDELSRYVIDTNDIYSKSTFKALYSNDPEFRKAVDLEAKKDAQAIAENGIEDPKHPGHYVLNLDQFRSYVESQPKTKKEKFDVLKALTGFLSDKHLHISKSTMVKQSANGSAVEPARFAWTKGASGPAVFTVDAALSYSMALPAFGDEQTGVGEFFLQPAVEAHTSTNPKAQQDSISAKIPLQFVFNPANDMPIAAHYLSISPIYETDHVQNTETYGGEIFYSPTVPGINIGSLRRLPGLPDWITFSWRPYVGFEGAEVSQTPPKTGYKLPPEFIRFAAKLHTDLYFSNRFNLAMDYCHRNFFYGDDASFDYVEVSPIFYIDEDQHFSLGMTYKNGYTSPQFSWVHSIGLWVGIKF
jgi:hypothetical protein